MFFTKTIRMITHEFCRLSGSELIRQFYDPRIVPFSFQTVACLNESGGKNKKILQREKYNRIKCVLRVKESECVFPWLSTLVKICIFIQTSEAQ